MRIRVATQVVVLILIAVVARVVELPLVIDTIVQSGLMFVVVLVVVMVQWLYTAHVMALVMVIV